MRSVRGSRPKIASDNVTEPAFLPSSVVTCSSMSRALPGRADRDRRFGRIVGELELTRLRHAIRQILLHRVAHHDPAALDAGHGAFDQDQAARDVGLPDFQVECGHPVNAKMTGHLLVLKRFSWILPAAGRADRTVRNGDAVAGPQ